MKNRIIGAVLVSSLIMTGAAATSCQQNNKQDTIDTTETSLETKTAGESIDEATTRSYSVPQENYDGHTFSVLNVVDARWNCYNKMAVEELTGEVLDDAVYNRNLKLENDLNIVISVPTKDLYDLNAEILRVVRAGDNVYDIAYLKADASADILAEKAVYNLYDVGKLQLDEPWYDRYVKDGLTVDDKLYFITNANQLMATSLLTSMYFNKSVLQKNGLEEPYDLVREGKWTLDAVYDYVNAAANMGTQQSFEWDENGDATYGMVLHNGMYRNMFCGTGEKIVTTDENGKPQYNKADDRFYAVLEKMSKAANVKDGFAISQHDCDCSNAFQDGKVLFRYYELRQILSAFRDMESDYGVVPSPKFDEAQDSYYSMTSQQTAVMSIPVTNTDLERTGTIVDYMSYLSYSDLWPAFIDRSVTNKGLRDEDSVEMLGIIRSTTIIDMGMVYGWTNKLIDALCANVKQKDNSFASTVAKYEQAVQQSIDDSLKAWNE